MLSFCQTALAWNDFSIEQIQKFKEKFFEYSRENNEVNPWIQLCLKQHRNWKTGLQSWLCLTLSRGAYQGVRTQFPSSWTGRNRTGMLTVLSPWSSYPSTRKAIMQAAWDVRIMFSFRSHPREGALENLVADTCRSVTILMMFLRTQRPPATTAECVMEQCERLSAEAVKWVTWAQSPAWVGEDASQAKGIHWAFTLHLR